MGCKYCVPEGLIAEQNTFFIYLIKYILAEFWWEKVSKKCLRFE